MTTLFPSSMLALERGLYYAGSAQGISELIGEKKVILQFGNRFPVELYKVKGMRGDCEVAVEKLRDGFALWLLNGRQAIRV